MKTITSANSSLVLVVPQVFPVPVVVQGYAADDAFMTEAVDAAEAQMGVDGLMSAGFTPFITKFGITLQADSPSVDQFEVWLGAQQARKDLFFAAAGTLVLPSLQKSYIFTKGALTRITPVPPGKKVLQPVNYEISWELCQPVPLAPVV